MPELTRREAWELPAFDEPFDDAPDPDDDSYWFTCSVCRRQYERPALIIFALEFCHACFGAHTGQRILTPHRARPAVWSDGEAGEAVP